MEYIEDVGNDLNQPIEVPENVRDVMRVWWRNKIMTISHADEQVTEGITIYDDAHNCVATLPYGHTISHHDLRTEFGTIGHAFSLDFTSSYVVPLWLDFDCVHETCSSKMAIELYPIQEAVNKCIFGVLGTSDINVDIYLKKKKCSLHFYYNVSVSTILLHQIIIKLRSDLPLSITENYTIDMFSHLALPYSRKLDDDEKYYPIKELDTVSVSVSATKYYDINNIILTRNPPAQYFRLGCFEWQRDTEFEQEWAEFEVNDHSPLFLMMPSEWSTSIKHTVPNYKIDAPFTTPLNQFNLATYLNRRHTKLVAHEPLMVDKTFIYYKQLEQLAKKIAQSAYRESGNDDMFNFLIRVLQEPNGTCGYAWYILIAIAKWCADTTDDENLENVKNTVLCFFEKLTLNNAILQHYIKCTKQVVIMQRMQALFNAMNNSKPTRHGMPHGNDAGNSLIVKWVAPICREILHENFKFDELFKQTSRPCTSDELKNEAVRYLTKGIIAFKDDPKGDRINVFQNGTYINLSREDTKTNPVYIDMGSYVNQHIQDKQTLPEWGAKVSAKSVQQAAHAKWIAEMPMITNMPTNTIPHIISTNLGNFLTITGTYMAKVPFLNFTTAKQYAINFKTPNQSLIIEGQQALQRVVAQFLVNIPKLFIVTTLVPGLLTMDSAIINEDTGLTTLMYIINNILLENENERVLVDLFMPVLQKYNFNMKAILKLAQLLQVMQATNIPIDFSHITQAIGKHGTLPVINELQANIHYDSFVLDSSDEFIASTMEFYNITFDDDHGRVHIDYNSFVASLCIAVISTESLNSKLPGTFYSETRLLTSPTLSGEMAFKDYFKRFLNLEVESSMVTMLYSLCLYFKFDMTTIEDFLSFCSMVYQPTATRKFVMILIGPAFCGKSTIIRHFAGSNAGSCLSSVKGFSSGDATDAPSPSNIRLYNSYVAAISEVSQLNPEQIKSITGSDAKDMRTLYDATLREFKPLPFIISAANTMPRTTSYADNALKTRMAFFKLPTQFKVKEKLTEPHNILLQFVNNESLRQEITNNTDLDMAFANIIFSFFVLKRDPITASLQPSMRNSTSLDLLEQFMVVNNPIIRILQESGAIFGSNYSTTVETIRNNIAMQLEHVNANTKRKFTADDVILGLSDHFDVKGDAVYGLTYNRNVTIYMHTTLSPMPGAITTLQNVKRALYTNLYREYCQQLDENLQYLITKYSEQYDPVGQKFINLVYE